MVEKAGRSLSIDEVVENEGVLRRTVRMTFIGSDEVGWKQNRNANGNKRYSDHNSLPYQARERT